MSKKDSKGYPVDIAGAVMKDKDGNEVFVSEEHQVNAVAHRVKDGWQIVDDRRPKTPPPAPDE